MFYFSPFSCRFVPQLVVLFYKITSHLNISTAINRITSIGSKSGSFHFTKLIFSHPTHHINSPGNGGQGLALEATGEILLILAVIVDLLQHAQLSSEPAVLVLLADDANLAAGCGAQCGGDE